MGKILECGGGGLHIRSELALIPKLMHMHYLKTHDLGSQGGERKEKV